MLKRIVLCGAVLIHAVPVLADAPTDANKATKSSVSKGSTHKGGRSTGSIVHGPSYPVKAPVDTSTGHATGKRKHNPTLVTPPK
ncbi:MAG TPA: hypothetical protein VKG05_15330 [Steroidobacteraceae bacterium]|nr:hypothetical protein [Steroidobacteraceae bacterium]